MESLELLLGHLDECLQGAVQWFIDHKGATLDGNSVDGLCFNISGMRGEIEAAGLIAELVKNGNLCEEDRDTVNEALGALAGGE